MRSATATAGIASNEPTAMRLIVGIAPLAKQQRMAADHADVLMLAVAIGQPRVGVVAEETRERVAHARDRSVLGQVVRTTSAPPQSACGGSEDAIVHVMTPQRAGESRHPGRDVPTRWRVDYDVGAERSARHSSPDEQCDKSGEPGSLTGYGSACELPRRFQRAAGRRRDRRDVCAARRMLGARRRNRAPVQSVRHPTWLARRSRVEPVKQNYTGTVPNGFQRAGSMALHSYA